MHKIIALISFNMHVLQTEQSVVLRGNDTFITINQLKSKRGQLQKSG